MHSDERNIQIVIELLKAHNVMRIIISPEATNISFVGSVLDDSFFRLYFAINKYSAVYIACDMATETGKINFYHMLVQLYQSIICYCYENNICSAEGR